MAKRGERCMDMTMKDKFIALWNTYFNGAELPVTFYYTDEERNAELVPPPTGHQCVVGVLEKARRGASLCFAAESVGCGGGKRYLGFAEESMPNFQYFLSYGIPGKLEGERYKKCPELVTEIMKKSPKFKAPERFIVFKRWDKLANWDNPVATIFFASPDVLSGLFTLANFDEGEPNGVFSPFAAGCGSIVMYPYLEQGSERPRGILGMFDVSSRPCVPEGTLTMAFPMKKFLTMIADMEESFLIRPAWEIVRKRIEKKKK
jgi:uncharacterized protein (DUF169 family)